jgi:tetratricopeptide (TPR) repeat protein
MKSIFLIFFITLCSVAVCQTKYNSKYGITLSFDSSWKRLSSDILKLETNLALKFIKDTSHVNFDACFRKYSKDFNSNIDILVQNNIQRFKEENLRNYQMILSSEFNIDNQNCYYFKGQRIQKNSSYCDSLKKIIFLISDFKFDTKKFLSENSSHIFDSMTVNNNLICVSVWYFGINSLLKLYVYTEQDNLEIAFKDLLKIINSIKDNKQKWSTEKSEGFYNQGIALSNQSNWSAAIVQFEKAINYFPLTDSISISEALCNIGICNIMINKNTVALKNFTNAIIFNKNNLKAYLNRGYCKKIQKDYMSAVKDFSEVINRDTPNSKYRLMALDNRAFTKFILNEDGCKDLQELLELGDKKSLDYYNKHCKK